MLKLNINSVSEQAPKMDRVMNCPFCNATANQFHAQAKRLIIQTERIYFHRIKIYIYIWFEGDCFACSLIHSTFNIHPFVRSFIRPFIWSICWLVYSIIRLFEQISIALLSNRGSTYMIDIFINDLLYFLLFCDPL